MLGIGRIPKTLIGQHVNTHHLPLPSNAQLKCLPDDPTPYEHS